MEAARAETTRLSFPQAPRQSVPAQMGAVLTLPHGAVANTFAEQESAAKQAMLSDATVQCGRLAPTICIRFPPDDVKTKAAVAAGCVHMLPTFQQRNFKGNLLTASAEKPFHQPRCFQTHRQGKSFRPANRMRPRSAAPRGILRQHIPLRSKNCAGLYKYKNRYPVRVRIPLRHPDRSRRCRCHLQS